MAEVRQGILQDLAVGTLEYLRYFILKMYFRSFWCR